MTDQNTPSSADTPADPAAVLDEPTVLGSEPAKADDKPANDAPKGDEPKPEDKPADEPKPDSVAPEKYELTPPEGMELDAGMVEAITPALKGLNLTNEQAQQLTAAYAEHVLPKVVEQLNTQAQQQVLGDVTAIRKQWADEWKADAEIGGNDDAREQKRSVMAKAIDDLVGPKGSEHGDAFRAFLNDTGLGNNPMIARLLYRAGSKLSEAEVLHAERGGSNKSTAAKMFDPAFLPPDQRT